jgi:hypothetical protein
MRNRFVLVLSLILHYSISFSQTSAHQFEVSTIKVWGVLKYYSPYISSGNINWDKVLLELQPKIKNVQTIEEFNILISGLVDTVYNHTSHKSKVDTDVIKCIELNKLEKLDNFSFLKDTVKYIRRPDFSWIMKDENLSQQNRIKLIEIIINYKPVHKNVFLTEDRLHIVRTIEESNEDIAYVINDGTEIVVPVEYSFLALARFWNVINYLYPYKNLLDANWDSFLINSCQLYETIPYYSYINSFAPALNEGHAILDRSEIKTPVGLTNPQYVKYIFPFTTKLIDEKIYIDQCIDSQAIKEANVISGDEILSINNQISPVLLEKIKSRISFGNESAFKSSFEQYFTLFNLTDSVFDVVLLRDSKTINVRIGGTTSEKYHQLYSPFTDFMIIDSTTVYINIATPSVKFNQLLSESYQKDIILDLRKYPVGENMNLFCNFLANRKIDVAHYYYPSVKYPGVFESAREELSFREKMPLYANFILTKESKELLKYSRKHFRKEIFRNKLVVLIDGSTISAMETLCMMIKCVYPDAVFIGRQTAGSNGNMVYMNLLGGVRLSYSSIDFHFADGTQTQRVGHIPNIVVEDNIEDFKNDSQDIIFEESILFIKNCR